MKFTPGFLKDSETDNQLELSDLIKAFVTHPELRVWIILEALGLLGTLVSFPISLYFSPRYNLVGFFFFFLAMAMVCHWVLVYRMGKLGVRNLPKLREESIQFAADVLEEIERRKQQKSDAKSPQKDDT